MAIDSRAASLFFQLFFFSYFSLQIFIWFPLPHPFTYKKEKKPLVSLVALPGLLERKFLIFCFPFLLFSGTSPPPFIPFYLEKDLFIYFSFSFNFSFCFYFIFPVPYFLFISPYLHLVSGGWISSFSSSSSSSARLCCVSCSGLFLVGVKAVVWDDWVVDLGAAVQNAAPPSEKPPPPPISNPPTETHDQIVVHQSTSTTSTTPTTCSTTCNSATSTTFTSTNQQVIDYKSRQNLIRFILVVISSLQIRGGNKSLVKNGRFRIFCIFSNSRLGEICFPPVL